MSWAPVVVCGTIVICFVTCRLYGDKNYSGPVRALTRWEAGAEIDLQSTLRMTNRSVSLRKDGSIVNASKTEPNGNVEPIVRTETATISPPVSDASVTPSRSNGFKMSVDGAPGLAPL